MGGCQYPGLYGRGVGLARRTLAFLETGIFEEGLLRCGFEDWDMVVVVVEVEKEVQSPFF